MIKAKKKFGQNFLKDSSVVDKIIQSMPNDELIVVEIGPGLGDLTKKLLQKRKVIAFEIDDELCEILNSKFASEIEEEILELRCIDVLQHWKDSNLIEKRYNLVANLPYYIATKIVLNLIKDDNCNEIIVMLQSEVAYKFCANSLDKEFSALSILADLIGKRSIVCDVDAKCFSPVPKVSSSVLKIERKRSLVGDIFEDEKELFKFEQFLKEAFRQPRKTLSKNLKVYDNKKVLECFDKLNIDPKARPHQLSSSKYLKIFNMIFTKDKDDRQQTDNPGQTDKQ